MCPFVEKQLRVPAEKPDYTFLQIRLLPGMLRILWEKNLFKGTKKKQPDSTLAPEGLAVFCDATTCHSACSALISCLLLCLDVV